MTPLCVHRTATFVSCVLLCVAGPGQAPGRAAQPHSGATNRIISPVAVVSSIVRDDGGGGALLDLAVLWRGAPGWFAQGGAHSESGGGSGSSVHSDIRYGDVKLTLNFNAETRVAGIQGTEIKLRDANVVLVDYVDSRAGPQVIRTLRVDPAVPGGALDIAQALRRSPEIVSFLRCDAGFKMPDISTQSMVDAQCAELLGK
jgi:hypothetical protein